MERILTRTQLMITGIGVLVAFFLTMSAVPGEAAESPAALASSLEEAFSQRDVALYGSLLSEDFHYGATCGGTDRVQEIEVMTTIFEDESRFEIVKASVEKVEEVGEFGNIGLAFEIKLLEDDPITNSVVGKGFIRAKSDETGNWLIYEWIEIFTREERCGSGLGWSEARTRWSSPISTAVSFISWSKVKKAILNAD